MFGRSDIKTVDRKFANKAIAMLADLTSTGKKEWSANDDRTVFFTSYDDPDWNITITGHVIEFYCGWEGHRARGSFSLAETQTGRLLHMLVTVPGAVEADHAMRKASVLADNLGVAA